MHKLGYHIPLIILLLIMVSISTTFLVEGEERVSKLMDDQGREHWLIEEPDVTQATRTYSNIMFQAGDIVTFSAGGCVQTGGAGKTWKNYVYPTGSNSGELYHGLVQIPRLDSTGLKRLEQVVGHKITATRGAGCEGMGKADCFDGWQLTLGYEDDDYEDNGYWSHDDGTENQCKGVGPAWVGITITRYSSRSQSADLYAKISTILAAQGMELGSSIADSQEYKVHYNWAIDKDIERLMEETDRKITIIAGNRDRFLDMYAYVSLELAKTGVFSGGAASRDFSVHYIWARDNVDYAKSTVGVRDGLIGKTHTAFKSLR